MRTMQGWLLFVPHCPPWMVGQSGPDAVPKIHVHVIFDICQYNVIMFWIFTMCFTCIHYPQLVKKQ